MGIKQSFVTALTEVRSYSSTLPANGAVDGLGSIRYENQHIYKYVQFSGTTTVAAGDVVCYVVASSDGNAVIVDGANNGGLGAGVAMAAVASGTVQYGWIKIRGEAILSTALAGSPSAGQTLTTVGATAPAMTLVAAATSPALAIAYDVTNKKVLCYFPW